MRGGSREIAANLVYMSKPLDAIRDLGEPAQQFVTDLLGFAYPPFVQQVRNPVRELEARPRRGYIACVPCRVAVDVSWTWGYAGASLGMRNMSLCPVITLSVLRTRVHTDS